MSGLRMNNSIGVQPDYGSMKYFGVPSADSDFVNLGDGIGAPELTNNFSGWGTTSPGVLGGSSLGSVGAPVQSNTGGLFDSFFQQKDANGATSGGWGSAGMGVIQGLGNAYLGMKQYGLMKDQLAFSKEQFNKNWGAQQAITNSDLEYRHNSRLSANPNGNYKLAQV